MSAVQPSGDVSPGVIPWSNGFRHRGQKYSFMLLSMLDAGSKQRLSIATRLFAAIEDGQDCKASGRSVLGVALKDASRERGQHY